MSNEELGRVRVSRFDPQVDGKPAFVEYQVPWQGRTVLDVLLYILEQLDPSLAFRYGCAGTGSSERCGACAVLVNGKAVMSCKTLAEKEMTIEPHPKFEVVKDLVIDFSRERKQRARAQAHVIIEINHERCTGCRDCLLICPVGVYEVRKEGAAKAVAVPVDIVSCCACRQCAVFCPFSAISIIEEAEK